MNGARPNPSQAHVALSVGATAQTLSELGYTPELRTALVQLYVEGGSVRVTVNGTAPTTTLGVLWKDGTLWEMGIIEASVAKFILESGQPAKLQVLAFTA
jgi:hypothetical protein